MRVPHVCACGRTMPILYVKGTVYCPCGAARTFPQPRSEKQKECARKAGMATRFKASLAPKTVRLVLTPAQPRSIPPEASLGASGVKRTAGEEGGGDRISPANAPDDVAPNN